MTAPLLQKLVLIFTLICGIVVFENNHFASILLYQKEDENSIVRVQQATSRLSLVVGELPGYTGWARPEFTLAGYFEILLEESPRSTTVVDTEWSISLVCSHVECVNGGAHFFVRAYGPAVITGRVQDLGNGKYKVKFLPLDPGQYSVEVVLVASHCPAWDAFPVENDPAYEGYLLPGFPMQLLVESSMEDTTTNGRTDSLCTFDQLVETDSSSAHGKRRWVVVDKVATENHYAINVNNDISIQGYRLAQNSLGIMMDYKPKECSLLPQHALATNEFNHAIVDKCFGEDSSNNGVHIIFVGDSVSLLQQEQMQQSLSGNQTIRTTRVSTSNGIHVKFDSVIQQLDSLKNEFPQERRFILFNTGLHDIAQLCSGRYRVARSTYLNESDAQLSCTREYRRYFERLVDYIAEYPAELRVFQSTFAGWLRYGNYGFGWKPDQKQIFSLSSNLVAHFNDIALDVLSVSSLSDKLYIMDAYWMSLSRPDNRQVARDNPIGKHLVHPGVEVLDAMGRIWWMIILRVVCGEALDNISSSVYG